MSSSRNEAELMAFMEAVVNEECKNAFTSNDHERPTVWRSGRQNSIDCPIILQNVYYASKEDPRQPFLCTNRGETEDSNHSSEPETTVSRKTTSVGVFSAKPLQENESASEYDKLQESYGCNPWCKVKLSVENPNDESTVTCYHLHGRPNTITIVRGLTDLQSNADSELHQFHVHPKSLTSPPTKLGRYFQPHPDSKEWIGNACLWRTMNGFTEEVQVAEGKNSDVPQSEYHANQSQFTVSQPGARALLHHMHQIIVPQQTLRVLFCLPRPLRQDWTSNSSWTARITRLISKKDRLNYHHQPVCILTEETAVLMYSQGKI